MSSNVPACAAHKGRNAVVALALLWGLALPLMGRDQVRADDSIDVPLSCGSSAELEQETRERLGSNGQKARPAVDMRMKEDGSYRLSVSTPDGPRVLEDADCRVLFRAAVLITVLAMSDGQALAFGAREQGVHEAALSAATAPAQSGVRLTGPAAHEAPRPARVRLEQTRDRAWQGSAALRTGVGAGIVPNVSALVGFEFGLTRAKLRLAFEAHYLTPREHLESRGVGVRVDALGASCSVGYEPSRAFGLAAGLSAFLVHGRGSPELSTQRSDFAWLWGPRLEAAWRFYRTRQLDLELSAAGHYFPDKDRFRLSSGEDVYATSRVAGDASMGARWRFP